MLRISIQNPPGQPVVVGSPIEQVLDVGLLHQRCLVRQALHEGEVLLV
jgi:hypothetical protein